MEASEQSGATQQGAEQEQQASATGATIPAPPGGGASDVAQAGTPTPPPEAGGETPAPGPQMAPQSQQEGQPPAGTQEGASAAAVLEEHPVAQLSEEERNPAADQSPVATAAQAAIIGDPGFREQQPVVAEGGTQVADRPVGTSMPPPTHQSGMPLAEDRAAAEAQARSGGQRGAEEREEHSQR